MIEVKPCPEVCKFDWEEFHKQLDWAMAHLIEEAGSKAKPEDYLPSKISLMDFAGYSNQKRLLAKK